MDGLHVFIWVRIRPSGQEDAVPAYACLKDGSFFIPASPQRFLSLEKWKMFWDNLKYDIDIWHPATMSWKAITTWSTIHNLMNWEKRNARKIVSKAAE